MEVLLWSDYLCPWCYLGRDRTRLLVELGATVTHLPYELHPEIPPEGRRVRPDGRLGPTFDRIEAECTELGIPFRRPARMPNTRRALEVAELTRLYVPGAFAALDNALFDAQWVAGDDIGDPDLVDALAVGAGVILDELHDHLADGVGTRVLATSMTRARAVGVVGTPSWVFGDFVLPGSQPRDTFERWAAKILARAAP
jgi:predicted DsbA family dithiol-disulfide isomerase